MAAAVVDPAERTRVSAAPIVGRPEAPAFGFAPKDVSPALNCSNCGFANSPGNTYCPECGALLAGESSPIVTAARRSLPPLKSQGTAILTPDPEQRAVTADAVLVTCPQCRHPGATVGTKCPSCGSFIRGGALDSRLDAPAVGTMHPGEPRTQRPQQLATADAGATSGPSLMIIAQDGTEGRCYPISGPQVDIGRDEGDIRLPNDRFINPRHARFLREGTRVIVQDLSSVNGVYRRLRNPVKLEHGDVFLLGLAVLKFELLAAGEQHLKVAIDRGIQVFGSPPSPRYARLSELTMEGVSRSIFVIVREETILGREVGDIVFSSDPFMSRRHAAIARNNSDGSLSLVDLGSSNGTFVRIRGQVELTPGDHVRIGQHLFRYDLNNGQVLGRVPEQEQAQSR